ncbi:hypothetical protein PFLUV_G00093270 [Perca fluviatilis]|uniref:Pentraxin (PTX) domain-containing protein n=1 Tax=Perca fluviatilis TaxID=8168 RepID=A0A6A5F7D0_PERFL|nr:uncharacterized protein LOC120563549 [Perca fluviatilis]KAF1386305.1 hypothetical protein PFLUV_G00093270 [Perca fluviatilis]
MKMKSKLLYAPMAMVVMSALVGLTSPTTTTRPAATRPTWTTTTGASGLDLNGKMFTLSRNRAGISFYSPYFSPTTPPYPSRRYPTRSYTPRTTTPRPWTTTPRTTTQRPWTTTPRTTTRRPWTTTPRPRTTTPRPWTTAPPTRGVSVCLRYLPDYRADIYTIFTLSPSSRSPLQMGVSPSGSYRLSFYGYSNLYLQPYKRFSSNIFPEIWTRVCLTVDTMKNVAQVFSDWSMSIRKMLPTNYVWSGEPVIDFSGFDGQVTDVQIWDYPLHYREVVNYMTSGAYWSYSGSALSWSYISYSPRGNVLLEDVYERQWQDRQPINRSKERKGRRPKGEKKTREFFHFNEGKREQP